MIRRALVFIGILAVGCERESDPAAASKSFFDQLSQKQLGAAFADATFFFQHEQTRPEFEASAHELGLYGCTVVKAESPSFVGKVARQVVVIRTPSGGQIPLTVTLARDRGAWRIFSLKLPMDLQTGVAENRFTRIGRGNQLTSFQDNPLPDEGVARAMTKETMLRFHDAIQQKSFEDFYEGVAREWQKQLTLGMLTRTFQGFVAQRTNLIAIKDQEPVFKIPPRIDSDGLLSVSGSYLTRPHRIDFDIKYYYELPDWRPFGVTVRLIE